MTLETLYTVVGQLQDVLDNIDAIMKQLAAVDKSYSDIRVHKDDAFLVEILQNELKIMTKEQYYVLDRLQDLRRRSINLIEQFKRFGYSLE